MGACAVDDSEVPARRLSHNAPRLGVPRVFSPYLTLVLCVGNEART